MEISSGLLYTSKANLDSTVFSKGQVELSGSDLVTLATQELESRGLPRLSKFKASLKNLDYF